MAQTVPPLRIIAHPKAFYRARYLGDIRNRAQRFIRADPNPNDLEYATIEIPIEWNRQHLYIRVTSVTVWTEQVPVRCVHPYPIDSSESNVIKDVERNTLYFPISQAEFLKGQKSFRITCCKLIQGELRDYGQLRLLNTDEKDIQRTDDPNNVRKLIDTYQLKKSQLLFSIAELVQDGLLPIIYDTTSVYSNIMTATKTITNDDESLVRCAPQKGNWQGGDEILMIIPEIDKKKTYKVCFEHPSMNEIDQIHIEFVDSKTISFITPPCPIQVIGNQRIEIPIVIIQDDEEIARVNFLYESFDKCSNCNTNLIFDSFYESNTYEQFSTTDTFFDEIDTFI